jgi:hypothetical protein
MYDVIATPLVTYAGQSGVVTQSTTPGDRNVQVVQGCVPAVR